MKNNQYWKKRADLRMYGYHKNADKIADDIGKSYLSASDYISEEIRKIFLNFQNESGLSEKDAKELLNSFIDKEKLNRLKLVISKVKDPEIRKKLMNIISSPAYAYRIKRFEQLQEDIEKRLSELAETELNKTRTHYIDTVYDAYHRCMFDTQKGIGLGFQFADLPITRVTEILDNAWLNKHYSERIWANSEELTVKLKQELLTGFLTGRSYHKTAKEIQAQLGTGAFETRRLVRTESTYVANMAEMESYKEAGIQKYRFVATLDITTSEMCRNMDGKEFDVQDAVPGENLPPLHPWCRSTTIAVLDKQKMNQLQRRARDPVTGKTYLVPADMSYHEWYNQYVKTNPQAKAEVKKYKNLYSDKKQHQKYRAVLGDEIPKTFAKFQDLKYNNIVRWMDLKGAYRYINANNGATINDYHCMKELHKLFPNGHFHIPPKNIDITKLNFDEVHVNAERNHHVTEEEAKNFIVAARVSKTVWKGQFERYYSNEGAAYVNNLESEIRTAFKAEEFGEEVKTILEVLRKYGIGD